MDRLSRWLLAPCGLGLILAASGCRSTKSDVPPGPKFGASGAQSPPVAFSHDATPAQAPATNYGGMAPSLYGTQAPGMPASSAAPTTAAPASAAPAVPAQEPFSGSAGSTPSAPPGATGALGSPSDR
jgi:hypothetical protein